MAKRLGSVKVKSIRSAVNVVTGSSGKGSKHLVLDL